MCVEQCMAVCGVIDITLYMVERQSVGILVFFCHPKIIQNNTKQTTL